MAAPAPAGEDLSERYLWYLEVGRQSLVDALGLLADPASLPLVFHCAAGKDRTGVLAALVLDILGVDDEVIVADYLITAGRMELILGRYRSDPVFAERMARVPPSRFGVEAGTMVRFLAELDARFGGARAWAVELGRGSRGPRPDGGAAARAGRLSTGVGAGRAPAPTTGCPRRRVDAYTGCVVAALWEPILAGALIFATAADGRVRGGRAPALALRPAQVARLPLARGGGRSGGAVGGHRHARVPAAGTVGLRRGVPVDAAPGAQGAVARGGPGRCRGAGGHRGRRAHCVAARAVPPAPRGGGGSRPGAAGRVDRHRAPARWRHRPSR